MTKPIKEYTFKRVDCTFQNVSGESETLGEVQTTPRILGYYIYNVYLNGIKMYWDIISWRTALAHAERLHKEYIQYNSNTKVEILNIITGEIVTYLEAKRRADALKRG